MAKHVWSVLCYKGVLDQYTNQVSLLDVIEGITAKLLEPINVREGQEIRFPVNFMLVTLWVRSDLATPEQVTARVRMVAPDGKARQPNIVKVDLTKHVRSRSFMRFENLPYVGEGYFTFVVEREGDQDEWEKVAEVPLEFKVEIPKAPAEVAAAAEKPEP